MSDEPVAYWMRIENQHGSVKQHLSFDNPETEPDHRWYKDNEFEVLDVRPLVFAANEHDSGDNDR